MYEIQGMTTRQRQGARSRQTAAYSELIGIAEEVAASARIALEKTAEMHGKDLFCRHGVKSPQRQPLPDDGGMEVRAVDQAFVIEVIRRIVQRRRTLAVTDEHEAAGHMF